MAGTNPSYREKSGSLIRLAPLMKYFAEAVAMVGLFAVKIANTK